MGVVGLILGSGHLIIINLPKILSTELLGTWTFRATEASTGQWAAFFSFVGIFLTSGVFQQLHVVAVSAAILLVCHFFKTFWDGLVSFEWLLTVLIIMVLAVFIVMVIRVTARHFGRLQLRLRPGSWTGAFHERVAPIHITILQTSLKARYPSSTLFPSLFGGLLIKEELQEKGYLYYLGLTGEPHFFKTQSPDLLKE